MTSSRNEILKAIRSLNVPPAELPVPFAAGIRYADSRQQFCDALALVGGTFLFADNAREADQQLRLRGVFPDSSKICSLVPGIGDSNFHLSAVADPHDLEDVDYAVVPGEFAVAENAAIWVSGEHLRHRVLPFITQHLVLVIPADQIVHNMHDAYERLQFSTGDFGVFISGPSKTADIEQSLVIGAHGARSLAVVLLGS